MRARGSNMRATHSGGGVPGKSNISTKLVVPRLTSEDQQFPLLAFGSSSPFERQDNRI